MPIQLIVYLTHKQLETRVCIIIIMATDALVIKHQAISIQNADWRVIVCVILNKFDTNTHKKKVQNY